MEAWEGKSGFVNFKSKVDGTKPQTVSIPEHLRANLPDPLAHLTNKKPAAPKAAPRVAGDSERLQAELAKLQAQREQTALRLKALKSKVKASSARLPPPPPSLASNEASKKNNTR